MPSFPSIQIAESLDVKFFEEPSLSQSQVTLKPTPPTEVSERTEALLKFIRENKEKVKNFKLKSVHVF
jgi:hypothetical protein